jgi:hypothetical protein
VNTLDWNKDPECIHTAQLGDRVWIDHTLYEVFAHSGDGFVSLRWSTPLQIRRDVPEAA